MVTIVTLRTLRRLQSSIPVCAKSRHAAYNPPMVDESGNFDPSAEPDEPSADGAWDDLPLVPLFPLPNIVLFPRGVLPLHIFEERYKAMTRDALEGDRQVAMALLHPGWEKSYHGRPAIEPVVCIGTILSHEELPDGKYNYLLQGTMRARVMAEVGNEPYRLARLQPIEDITAPTGVMRARRQKLIDLFTADQVARTAIGRQFAKILATPLPTSEIADLAAFTFIEDAALKQSLLAEADVARRVAGTIELLESALQSVAEVHPAEPLPVSPGLRFRNPSFN
jgi:uncharacterized protein